MFWRHTEAGAFKQDHVGKMMLELWEAVGWEGQAPWTGSAKGGVSLGSSAENPSGGRNIRRG